MPIEHLNELEIGDYMRLITFHGARVENGIILEILNGFSDGGIMVTIKRENGKIGEWWIPSINSSFSISRKRNRMEQ